MDHRLRVTAVCDYTGTRGSAIFYFYRVANSSLAQHVRFSVNDPRTLLPNRQFELKGTVHKSHHAIFTAKLAHPPLHHAVVFFVSPPTHLLK